MQRPPWLRGLLARWRARLEHRRLAGEARREVARLFREGTLLAGTSLTQRHAGRTVVLSSTTHAGGLATVTFGIVRHPRPYAFSPQSHKVLEVYQLDLVKRELVRLEGVNLTRREGRDSD